MFSICIKPFRLMVAFKESEHDELVLRDSLLYDNTST